MKSRDSLRRTVALCRKEMLQILRDPSSNIIAFVLPIVLLLIFGYGINLDTTRLRVGLVLQDTSPEAAEFAASLAGSPYLEVSTATATAPMGDALTAGQVRGFVVVPPDFAEKLERPGTPAPIQVITDGSEPNTANFVENYVKGAWEVWLRHRAARRGAAPPPAVDIEARFWFNPAAESRNYLIPGSITIIMTVIGALLTSLVVAREWERGTMEALLASPVTRAELLASKVIPYYLLGIVSFFACAAVAVLVMGVPFRGSFFMLWLTGSLFLTSALGLGLLISSVTRNQFFAALMALNAAFLPALILSGFLYEIRSMPPVIRAVTNVVPAKHFVSAIQTLFQAGDIWPVLWRAIALLTAASVFFLGLTALKTRRKLE